MITLLIWELICLTLLWTSFCRAVRVNKNTRLDIRLSLWALGLAALVCLGAPAYGWLPDFVSFILLSTVTLVQLVTATLWVRGVPTAFLNCPHLPHGRRCGDWK